jgi:hypothetical protein
VSTVFFNTELNGEYKQTEIKESSIGWGVQVGASVELTRTVVPPLRYVTESTVREAADERYCYSQSYLSLLFSERIVLLLYLVSYFMVLLSIVPSYELWMNVIQPSSVWIAVPRLAMMLGTQTISFLVLLYVISLAGFGGTSFKGRSKPWNEAFYNVYHSYNWCTQNVTMMSDLWGTPLFGFVLNLLGANVEGRFLYFGSTLFEIPYLSVVDRTVSDGAKLLGHYAVYSNIALSPVRASGILHENTLLLANSTVSDGCKENGPWRYIKGVTRLNAESPNTRPKEKPLPKGSTLKLRFEIVSTGGGGCLSRMMAVSRVEQHLVCKWEITGELNHLRSDRGSLVSSVGS